jgi:hypothetical protein
MLSATALRYACRGERHEIDDALPRDPQSLSFPYFKRRAGILRNDFVFKIADPLKFFGRPNPELSSRCLRTRASA